MLSWTFRQFVSKSRIGSTYNIRSRQCGVPKDDTKNTLVAEYNDKDSVQKLFDENKDQIAAVIVEPVAANMGLVLPEEGFLEFLREITKDSWIIIDL